MSAEIIYGVDFKAKKRTLEQQATEIMNVVLIPDAVIYESSLGWTDTSPSEYCAPDDDCA